MNKRLCDRRNVLTIIHEEGLKEGNLHQGVGISKDVFRIKGSKDDYKRTFDDSRKISGMVMEILKKVPDEDKDGLPSNIESVKGKVKFV